MLVHTVLVYTHRVLILGTSKTLRQSLPNNNNESNSFMFTQYLQFLPNIKTNSLIYINTIFFFSYKLAYFYYTDSVLKHQ